MARASDGRATAYAYEDIKRVALRSTSGGMAYSYEDVKRLAGPRSSSAGFYAYERAAFLPVRTSGKATFYAYEKSLTADPNQLFVYDTDLEEYVRVPWYVFNVDTNQWQQVT